MAGKLPVIMDKGRVLHKRSKDEARAALKICRQIPIEARRRLRLPAP
jgi:hypothetical protein